VVAVLCALALPFAPVSMSSPSVSWPQDPTRPESTALQLTAQRPLELTAQFSCSALAAARDGGDGLLLATVLPGRPSEEEGLRIRQDGDTLSVDSNRTEVHRGEVGPGACAYVLEMDATSTRLLLDGEVVADLGTGALPDVDVLATDVTTLAGADDTDLSVDIRVDDQFSTSPTAV